ncbi:unnamed protein product [Oppiella nova]|uniref:non-specific serine/threonine protein kinase n=1 Tax=Oppiella nova TaxID=334625 RepID=A0A7R9LRS1_9ACAR|nr:unnamed protein product [Oppiella nova]CAG2166252.1 unnamed protein product [Oppiella nova]
MLSRNRNKRPECREVLAKHNEWSIDKNILQNDIEFEYILNRLKSNRNSFFYEFLNGMYTKVTINGNSFQDFSKIGNGGFGEVFKVKYNYNLMEYALKRIGFEDFTEIQLKTISREVEGLSKVSSQYIVQYYDSWIKNKCQFIVMELCSQNLMNILEAKPHAFGRQPGDLINLVENGRFIKLCDFGLATVHDKYITNTKEVGDVRYMAPEVMQGRSQDIYPAAHEILNLELLKVVNLHKILDSMFVTKLWPQRPECREVLAKHKEWAIDRNIITNNNEIDLLIKKLKENENTFFYQFLIYFLK